MPVHEQISLLIDYGLQLASKLSQFKCRCYPINPLSAGRVASATFLLKCALMGSTLIFIFSGKNKVGDIRSFLHLQSDWWEHVPHTELNKTAMGFNHDNRDKKKGGNSLKETFIYSLLAGCPRITLNSLQLIQNAAARLLMKIRR